MSFCSLLHLYKPEVKSFSCVWLFVTPWTVAYQAPLSIGFSRQEYTGVGCRLNSPLKPPVSWVATRSWFSDRGPPSPPVAGLQTKATFSALPTLVSGVLPLKKQEVGPWFGNSILKNFKGFWKILSITFWNHFQRLFHDYLHHVSDHRGSCFRCHE